MGRWEEPGVGLERAKATKGSNRTISNKRPAETVLLVDADVDASEMYQLGLTQAGYHVQTARDAASLFEAMDHQDIVVAEWEGLGLPGREVVRRIRSRKGPDQLPILILTNVDGEVPKLERQAIDAGAQGWLVKVHTSPNTLLERIRSAIDINR